MAHNEFGEASGDAEEGRIERGATWGLTMPPVPIPQRTVRRARILREIQLRAQDVSATILIAPDGFGKTTLLAQRVAAVQADPERGVARMLDASGLDGAQLYEMLRDLETHLEPRMQPLVAIDNLPVLGATAIDGVVGRMRELHGKGFEFIVACRPNNRQFANGFGDAYKIGPQALAVRPKEFSDWSRVLGISSDVDVYELTQGIPALVSMLGMLDGRPTSLESFSRAVASLYEGILGDLRRDRDSLYRMACLLVLTGGGSLRDFERINMRVRTQSWSRLAREFPAFGVDIEQGSYRCLARRSQAMGELCRHIVHTRPLFAMRAIKVLVAADDMDRAVYVAGMLENLEDRLGVLAEHPTAFALSGNIAFVRDVMGSAGDVASSTMPVGAVLAMYTAALVGGELRVARALAVELKRRAREVAGQIEPAAWVEAHALSGLWEGCRGIELPKLDATFTQGHETAASRRLDLHGRVYAELVGGSGAAALGEDVCGIEGLVGEGISIPRVLLACDRTLMDIMRGDMGDARVAETKMQRLIRRLTERRLAPIAAHVRMVAATCRLLASIPVADERAFIDMGTLAVRTSDFPTQLFCLVGEGWQALELGQHSNALFRARQVLKLASADQCMIVAWARMLECCAHVLNAPRMSLDEEADLLDLSDAAAGPVDAWAVALRLSAARRQSELSAWCSMNKSVLLSKDFTVFARQAMASIGERAAMMRRALPEVQPDDQLAEPSLAQASAAASSILTRDAAAALLGQVNVRLFGGFQVERGGHVVTDAAWRRRKACVIAARLVLAGGAFVGRKELGEEVWPDKDYLHAREALYAGLTSLRAAFGQGADGPQYVLTQGEGVAVNTEYVVSDTMRFEMLARDILLRRIGTTGRQLIDACLQLEELYTGPLYVPNFGDSSFYVRQRRIYQAKFVDCMMRGIATALELDDLPVASWLVEAALRQAPMREDVIRVAMRIFDKSGRRREVVELYNSHVHVLERELHALPEKETQMAYEAIIQREGAEALLA